MSKRSHTEAEEEEEKKGMKKTSAVVLASALSFPRDPSSRRTAQETCARWRAHIWTELERDFSRTAVQQERKEIIKTVKKTKSSAQNILEQRLTVVSCPDTTCS